MARPRTNVCVLHGCVDTLPLPFLHKSISRMTIHNITETESRKMHNRTKISRIPIIPDHFLISGAIIGVFRISADEQKVVGCVAVVIEATASIF